MIEMVTIFYLQGMDQGIDEISVACRNFDNGGLQLLGLNKYVTKVNYMIRGRLVALLV